MPTRHHADAIEHVRRLVASGRYRIRLHAVRHMVEEGFDEEQLVEAVRGRLRVIEEYPEEERYLMLGRFRFTPTASSAKHILCDLSNDSVADIVTAYLPQRPWWITPTQRRKKK